MPLADAVALFADAPFRWWITGGNALELFLGRSWREHGDLDVSFRRGDAPAVRELFASWDVHVAAAGKLSPWRGEVLSRADHQNNLWCRRAPADPWCLDLTISEGDDEAWIFRRDLAFRVPWAEAVLRSAGKEIPYLAPELQLLFKAGMASPRPKDERDAAEVLPWLSDAQHRRLAERLPAGHPWLLLRRNK